MSKKQKLIYGLLAIGVLAIGGVSLFISKNKVPLLPIARLEYPFLFPKVFEEDKNVIREKIRGINTIGDYEKVEYKTLNMGDAKLDVAGFPDEIESMGFYGRELDKIPFPTQEEAVLLAREFIDKNKIYLNVDLETLRVKKYEAKEPQKKYDYPPFIWITFESQQYSGREIKNTELQVGLDLDRVWEIHGHWYPSFSLPATPELSVEEIKEILISKGFKYWVPEPFPGKEIHYKVTREKINSISEVIYPVETSLGIEMRLVYKIVLGEPLAFNIYMDGISGEIIEKEQLFVW